jgi:negative regulator of flagellin synthesis FlgM
MPDPIRGVNPAGPIEVSQTGQAGAAPTIPAANAPPPIGGKADSVDIARAQALLAAIAAAAGSVPSVDQARVAELRQALQSGTYQVQPARVAEKLVEIEALLAR